MGIKASEVRERLKGRCDEQVMLVLETIAEEQRLVRQSLFETAQNFDRLVDIVSNFAQIAENMKGAMKKLQDAQFKEEFDDGKPTH